MKRGRVGFTDILSEQVERELARRVAKAWKAGKRYQEAHDDPILSEQHTIIQEQQALILELVEKLAEASEHIDTIKRLRAQRKLVA